MHVTHDDGRTPLPARTPLQRRTADRPATGLLLLQRTAGNKAVVTSLRAVLPERTRAGGLPVSVQRQDDDAPAGDASEQGGGGILEKREEVEPGPEVEATTTDAGDQIAAVVLGDGMGDFPANESQNSAFAAPAAGFVDGGRQGTVRWGDTPLTGGVICAHAFTAGGMTGTTPWGPAGARSNQGVGTIQGEVLPVYQAQPAAPPVAALAWVQNGTGTMQVTRSYIGVNSGNQGNGYFVTPAAAARINQHEVGHVNSTRGFHDSDLKPLLDRILSHTQAQAGRGAGADQPAAIAALQGILGMPAAWNTSKANFATHDSAANAPGGTFDTADVATGTYPVDIGPGTVGGTAFAHRIKTPAEPAPAP